MAEELSPVVAGLGLGIALAGAPGPVQAILLAEALRGGVGRGLRALAGANLTFGVLLIGLALGVSAVVPSEPVLRILKLVGGGFVVWLAVDGLRARDDRSADRHESSAGTPAGPRPAAAPRAGRTLPPVARGGLAVLLNPGVWLFMATAASSLVTSATQIGGRLGALSAALALLVGVGAGDLAVVVAAGLGLQRTSASVGRRLRQVLALVLGALGLWLILNGLLS